MKRWRKILLICIIFFFRISINVNIFTLIAVNNFKKQWHFQCWSQYIYRSIQYFWKIRLQIESSNKVISKCPIVYHHWAPTLKGIAAAILTFCKMSIFVDGIFWKCLALTFSQNVANSFAQRKYFIHMNTLNNILYWYKLIYLHVSMY